MVSDRTSSCGFFAGNAMKKKDKTDNYRVEGMCLGMCFGAAISTSFGSNMGVCIPVGMLIGLVIGSYIKKE